MKKKNDQSLLLTPVPSGISQPAIQEAASSQAMTLEEESVVLLQHPSPPTLLQAKETTSTQTSTVSTTGDDPILLLDQDPPNESDLILLAPSQRVSSSSSLDAVEGYSSEQPAVGHKLEFTGEEEWDLFPKQNLQLDSTELPTDPLIVAAPHRPATEDVRSTVPAPIPPISGTHLQDEAQNNSVVSAAHHQSSVPDLVLQVDMTEYEEIAMVDDDLVIESIELDEDIEEVELTADDVIHTAYAESSVEDEEADLQAEVEAMFDNPQQSHAKDVLDTLSEEVRRAMETRETPIHLDSVPPSHQPTLEHDSFVEVDLANTRVIVQQSRRGEQEHISDSVRLIEDTLLRSAPMMVYKGQLSSYTLTEVLERESDRVLWQAIDATQESRSLLVEELSPSRYNKGYKRLPDLSETVIQTPLETLVLEDRVLVVFEQPIGERLSEIIDDLQYAWDLPQVIQFCKPIAEMLVQLHQNNLLFLQLSLDTLWIQENGTPLLTGVEQLYSSKTPFHMRPFHQGFSAPELFDRDFHVDRRADVFALAMLFHYMSSRCQPFNHLHLPQLEIPSPRVFDLKFPVALEHIFAHAYHPHPEHRITSVSMFMEQLERQWQALEERNQQEHKVYNLEIGHDLHIGIRKGKRNPVNQDALFWRYDRERGKGLFVVADGVSVCQYGSGDKASSLVIQVARKRWETLLEKPIFDQPFTQLQRHQVLRSIAESANKAIAQEVNRSFPAIHGFVEDVMGSTCVAAFVDGPNITIANLGDSRAMLKTEHFIEQITVDHNFKTFQMQSLEDMETVMTLDNGSLLTRCVGSFQKDEAEKLLVDEIHPDFFDFQLLPGDTVVLCSDGLTDYAGSTEEEKSEAIEAILNLYPDPLAACFWLVALANQNGGGDNISCIVLKVPN